MRLGDSVMRRGPMRVKSFPSPSPKQCTQRGRGCAVESSTAVRVFRRRRQKPASTAFCVAVSGPSVLPKTRYSISAWVQCVGPMLDSVSFEIGNLVNRSVSLCMRCSGFVMSVVVVGSDV